MSTSPGDSKRWVGTERHRNLNGTAFQPGTIDGQARSVASVLWGMGGRLMMNASENASSLGFAYVT